MIKQGDESGNEAHKYTKIQQVRIASYINDVVATRKLPDTDETPHVVMKLDVEGNLVTNHGKNFRNCS